MSATQFFVVCLLVAVIALLAATAVVVRVGAPAVQVTVDTVQQPIQTHVGPEPHQSFKPVVPGTPANANIPSSVVLIPQRLSVGGISFVLVPAGSLMIGSANSELGHQADELQRLVVIDEPFFISTCEVTADQYARHSMIPAPQGAAGEYPVTGTTWDEAVAFTWAFRAAFPEFHCRLPTEGEWEYACRAGAPAMAWPLSTNGSLTTAIAKYQGGDPGFLLRDLNRYVCFDRTAVAPVASLAANHGGLHDMLGNVWEWCEIHDLTPPSADYRPIRGGSWASTDILSCRAASRAWERRNSRKSSIGFRIVVRPINGPL